MIIHLIRSLSHGAFFLVFVNSYLARPLWGNALGLSVSALGLRYGNVDFDMKDPALVSFQSHVPHRSRQIDLLKFRVEMAREHAFDVH